MKFIDEILDNQKDYMKTAIIQNDREVTYHELKRCVYRMANILFSAGLKRNDRVIVFLPKSIESIICFFGAIKCGVTYVPVDFETPEERFKYILSNSSPKLIITNPKGVNLIRDIDTKILLISDFRCPVQESDLLEHSILWPGDYNESPKCLSVKRDENDIAYIIYTSGSTGNPKGVMIRQNSFVAFIESIQNIIKYSNNTKLLNVMPFHFDGSLVDIYCTLMAGGTMVLMEKFILPSQLVKAMEKYEITNICLVSSVLKLLVSRFSNIKSVKLPKLQTVWFGGEACSVDVIRTLKKVYPQLNFVHTYGPTEATCVTHIYTFSDVPKSVTSYFPIGKPLPTVRAYVLDENRKIVQAGEIGELAVGGIQVMEGYCQESKKTKEVLLEDKVHRGEKIYLTGDYVKVDNYGDYIFCGRKDNVIKSSGYLINMSEIEKALLMHDDVKDAIILYDLDSIGITRIKAIIVLYEDKSISAQDLKEFLKKKIPTYMIPEDIYFFDDNEILRNSSGKVDKRKLIRLINKENEV